MAAREISLDLGPAVQNMKAAGGDAIVFTWTLDWNTTGTTPTVELRLTDDTEVAAGLTLASGTGLVITPGATTSIVVTIPATFASATFADNIYAALVITTGTSRRTWIKGKIAISWISSR